MRLTRIMNNFHSAYISGFTYYFSYETLIGFSDGKGVTVSKNEWSRTTAKHINWIKNNYEAYEVPHAELLYIAV